MKFTQLRLHYLEDIKTKIETTKAKLDAGNYEGLTKDDMLGDVLYTTAMSYYAEAAELDYLQAQTLDVELVRLPSEAVFSLMLEVDLIFGTPLSVSAEGLFMDVDRSMTANVALNGNADNAIQFTLASGAIGSILEYSIPEQLFSTPENPVEGISAVKALQIANSQGIPIYTVTKDNLANILPQLSLDIDVIRDILNAVNGGKEVTVSKKNITYDGWIGCGYIVVDRTTGAAGHMISGGLAGGMILNVIGQMLSITNIMLSISEAEASNAIRIKTDTNSKPYFHLRTYYKCLSENLLQNAVDIGILLSAGAAAAALMETRLAQLPGGLSMLWIAYVGVIVAFIAWLGYIVAQCYNEAMYADE